MSLEAVTHVESPHLGGVELISATSAHKRIIDDVIAREFQMTNGRSKTLHLVRDPRIYGFLLNEANYPSPDGRGVIKHGNELMGHDAVRAAAEAYLAFLKSPLPQGYNGQGLEADE